MAERILVKKAWPEEKEWAMLLGTGKTHHPDVEQRDGRFHKRSRFRFYDSELAIQLFESFLHSTDADSTRWTCGADPLPEISNTDEDTVGVLDYLNAGIF